MRGQDLNLQPPGYEPDELPIALPRDMVPETGVEPARDRSHGILSPGRLPIPPLRLVKAKLFFVHYLQKQFHPFNPPWASSSSTRPAHLPPRMPRGYLFTYRWICSVSSSVIPVKSIPFGTLRRLHLLIFRLSLPAHWQALVGHSQKHPVIDVLIYGPL